MTNVTFQKPGFNKRRRPTRVFDNNVVSGMHGKNNKKTVKRVVGTPRLIKRDLIEQTR